MDELAREQRLSADTADNFIPTKSERRIRPELCMEELSEKKQLKRNEFLRDHEIRIQFLSVGCVIHVGCKSVPFTNSLDAMDELKEYIKDPVGQKKRWLEIFERE